MFKALNLVFILIVVNINFETIMQLKVLNLIT